LFIQELLQPKDGQKQIAAF
jgi:protein phosphatase